MRIALAWIAFVLMIGMNGNLEATNKEVTATQNYVNLIAAIKDRDVKGVKVAIEYGADVNAIYAGIPALHFPVVGSKKSDVADMAANIAIAKLLIKAGADVTAKNSQGSTALELAAWSGKTEFVKILKLAEAGMMEPTAPSSTTEFWQGAKESGGFQESFKYGFERGLQGNTPWYFWLFWVVIVGLFALACYKGAEKRGRNPWIWGGLTALCILLPLICWVPYVVLRILGAPDKQS